MFPFETHMFAATFKFLNGIGFNLPAEVTVMQEQQLSQLWHSVVGLALIVVIIAHIYIGTIGVGIFHPIGASSMGHLADQLPLWIALAGSGSFRTLEPTNHTRSQFAVLRTFLGKKIGCTKITPGVWEIRL